MKKLTIIKVGILCIFICTVFLGCGAKKDVQYYASKDGTSSDTSEEVNCVQTESEVEFESVENTDLDAESKQTQICVYVCGEVMNPGVYTLFQGERVCDAIALAGGFTEDADAEFLNQAELVQDSQKLYVPSEEETSQMREEGYYAQTQDGQSSMVQSSEDNRKVNINSATIQELTTITGIGETRAQAIIDYRTEHGRFSSTEDITNVTGIGAATYDKIKEDICVN